MKRVDAIKHGLDKYVPDKSCKRGHWLRYSSNSMCVECNNMHERVRIRDMSTYNKNYWRTVRKERLRLDKAT